MSIKINLRVSKDWKKRTEKEAKRKGVSLSEYLRTAADLQEKEVEGALVQKSDKEADGMTVVNSTYFVRCCRVEFTCHGAAYAQRCPVCGGRIKNVFGKDAEQDRTDRELLAHQAMSTFNILLLEDDPIRVTQFRARLAQIDHVLEHYESSHDTVNALRTRTYDLILLDHDLGGEVYVDPAQEEDCGMRVAEFFAANPAEVRKHGPIIIHSLNSPAAEQMLSLIGEAAYIPYVWQREVWNKYINIK